MKTLFKILCYIVAGFFIYMVAMIGFTRMPDMSLRLKLGVMGTFSAPMLGALAAGLSVSDRRWRDAGIVILSGGGLTVFVVGTLAYYLQQEEFRNMIPPETRAAFSAYEFGLGFLGAVLVIGATCLTLGWRQPAEAVPPRLGEV